MHNPSAHDDRMLSPSSIQEDHAPTSTDSDQLFAGPSDKSCKTEAIRSRARVCARRWPLALMALAFALPKASFASGSPFTHPTNPNYVLTKNRNYDLQTMPTTTKAGGSLIDRLSESLALTPLERIALTCSGNLQMVFSSYHLQPVEVTVHRDELLSPADRAGDGDEGDDSKPPLAVYDREVRMSIAGRVFCKATSRVRVYDAALRETLATEKVGIGQLLRRMGLAPRMTLHEAGRAEDGAMWRYYSMECDDMVEFDIVEEYSSDAWDLKCAK